jgi:hypothetical protein
MTQRLRRFTAFAATALFAAMLLFGGMASLAQNSDVDLSLHANSHATAADIGLPLYPGAKLYKDADNDSAVDLGFSFGDFRFTVMAANYVTSDSPVQILAFYRKPLSRYGEVLECSHGKPVGTLTVTHSGLTCSDQHGGHVQVNGSEDSSSDHELRAGAPHKYRVVGINDAHDGSTRFGLVYLELPKDNDEEKKSN